MSERALATLFLVCGLAACSGESVVATERGEYVLSDISFFGAHKEQRCTKGCQYIEVPDRWFLQFCRVDKKDNCFTRTITHAPWSWQQIGTRVTVGWDETRDERGHVVKWTQFMTKSGTNERLPM